VATRRLILREQARRDAEQAIDHYFTEAGERVALAFVDALHAAYSAISRHPGTGSPRYAVELDLPGLRAVALRGFPYLAFYMEAEGRIEIWRLLHAHRDIPAAMR
jgi:toxin ParE1/3/4